ncbi:hypothetical protein VIGAN_01250600 [Vigna angularis var. angularis]|uniref:Uncharacterized protein n=1 Tax=Vigna angularis var. angularis TaxID=157739 RepID=A0A0S3R2J2_PHAAN|nr:hypothetical protein VIGAN_01250600 [Vigna angularis var. angularis]
MTVCSSMKKNTNVASPCFTSSTHESIVCFLPGGGCTPHSIQLHRSCWTQPARRVLIAMGRDMLLDKVVTPPRRAARPRCWTSLPFKDLGWVHSLKK